MLSCVGNSNTEQYQPVKVRKQIKHDKALPLGYIVYIRQGLNIYKSPFTFNIDVYFKRVIRD